MTKPIGLRQAGGSPVARLLRFTHAATDFFPFFLFSSSLSLPLYPFPLPPSFLSSVPLFLPPLCVTLAVLEITVQIRLALKPKMPRL